MDNTACFSRRQTACCLFCHLQCQSQRKRPAALHPRFERFAMDQFHRVKTFAILFAIMNHPRDIRMLDLRSRTRFPQESGMCCGIFGQLSTDDFEATVESRIVSRARYVTAIAPEPNMTG